MSSTEAWGSSAMSLYMRVSHDTYGAAAAGELDAALSGFDGSCSYTCLVTIYQRSMYTANPTNDPSSPVANWSNALGMPRYMRDIPGRRGVSHQGDTDTDGWTPELRCILELRGQGREVAGPPWDRCPIRVLATVTAKRLRPEGRGRFGGRRGGKKMGKDRTGAVRG
ncbi:hypothetical protein GY45DRAFT_133976 [Cubamyces sp. BRFM 1775]|nr:hypothetical protein GY45DRAFT_133976 [Cubamyces sp. BRFM 1775]